MYRKKQLTISLIFLIIITSFIIYVPKTKAASTSINSVNDTTRSDINGIQRYTLKSDNMRIQELYNQLGVDEQVIRAGDDANYNPPSGYEIVSSVSYKTYMLRTYPVSVDDCHFGSGITSMSEAISAGTRSAYGASPEGCHPSNFHPERTEDRWALEPNIKFEDWSYIGKDFWRGAPHYEFQTMEYQGLWYEYRIAPKLKLEIDPDTRIVNVGSKTTFKAYYTGNDGTRKDVTTSASTSWSILDSTVAKNTTTKGEYVGLQVGTTTVKVTYGSLEQTATINVVAQQGLWIDPAVQTVIVGKTVDYKALYKGLNNQISEKTNDAASTWSAQDSSIASTTSLKGQFQGNQVGTTTVKVQYGSLVATATVNVVKDDSTPLPAPTSNNEPPTVTIYGPTEVKAGDYICLFSSSDDPDGEVVDQSWNDSSATTSISGSGGCISFMSEGDYQVSTVVTDDKGATGSDVHEIKVLPPTPVADFTIGGWLKENRRVDLDSTSTSPSLYPIDWSKSYWKLTASDTVNLVEIRHTGSLDGVGSVKALYKKTADYNALLHIENTAGYSDEISKTFFVKPDEPPIANFSTVTTIYRDQEKKDENGKPLAEMKITNLSRSIDDDIIDQSIYTLEYDADNDGKFDDGVLRIDSKEMTPGKEITVDFQGMKLYITMDEDMNLKILVPHVGKFKVELEVIEKFGQPAL